MYPKSNKVILCNIFTVPVFCYIQSHEVKCGIFHLWHCVSTQKLLDFVAFQILEIHMRDT
jgi:hypothetical protein